MSAYSLPKITVKSKKRLGRGYGSGKGGHTAGRGQKGQKSRGKVKLWFEGGQLPLIKRMPFLRGKGKLKPQGKAIAISLVKLAKIPAKSEVNVAALIKYGLLPRSKALSRVKIIGGGKISISLTVNLPTSKASAIAITKAGGKVISPKP